VSLIRRHFGSDDAHKRQRGNAPRLGMTTRIRVVAKSTTIDSRLRARRRATSDERSSDEAPEARKETA
jgi:hypothetical protein